MAKNEGLLLKLEIIFCFLIQNIGELLSQNTPDLEDKLEKIGDSIVHKLIEWVTRLPFYNQLPKELLTKLLTHKWHELLVLTTSAYQAIHGFRRMGTTRTDGEKVELHQEVIFKKQIHLLSGCYLPDISVLFRTANIHCMYLY